MNELALFAGAGGGLLGSKLLGWRTVCAIEIDKYRQQILLQRQRDGCLEYFPIWDDATSFVGRPWRGKVDVVTASDPCQENSRARQTNYTRHPSLGHEVIRIVDEVRPRFVFRENPTRVRADAPWPWWRIRCELEQIGYVVLPFRLRACCLGFDHQRDRLFLLAEMADTFSERSQKSWWKELGLDTAKIARGKNNHTINAGGRQQWQLEPELDRVAYGVANRVDRIGAIGDGQVPSVVFRAWHELNRGGLIDERTTHPL